MTINVNKEAVIVNVEGTRTHHACKPVINKTTGVVYASAKDAAEALGGYVSEVSKCCLGKIHSYKGNKLEYVKHASENVDSLTAQIRALNAKIAEMEADAAVGRAIREEREAKQKAEKERLSEIERIEALLAKETKRLAHRAEIITRKNDELQQAIDRHIETEQKIAELNMQLAKLEGK